MKEAAQIEGVYVPSLYQVAYLGGRHHPIGNSLDGAPERVRKRIMTDLDSTYYPDKIVVPFCRHRP